MVDKTKCVCITACVMTTAIAVTNSKAAMPSFGITAASSNATGDYSAYQRCNGWRFRLFD